MKNKPLFLILKKKYFDQIKSGQKTEEFRLLTPYFVKRLVGRQYDSIIFQNGYAKTSPRLTVEYLGYDIRNVKQEFFGNDEVSVFVLKLGNVTAHEISVL